MEKNEIKLKPCPFCQGNIKIVEGGDGRWQYDACCELIRETVSYFQTKEEAIEVWNNRNDDIDRLVELQQYIFVATMADCFVDLKPEHRLYENIRQDLKAALRALKMPAQEKENDCEKCDNSCISKKIEGNAFPWYNSKSDEIMAEYIKQWEKKYKGKNDNT